MKAHEETWTAEINHLPGDVTHFDVKNEQGALRARIAHRGSDPETWSTAVLAAKAPAMARLLLEARPFLDDHLQGDNMNNGCPGWSSPDWPATGPCVCGVTERLTRLDSVLRDAGVIA